MLMIESAFTYLVHPTKGVCSFSTKISIIILKKIIVIVSNYTNQF